MTKHRIGSFVALFVVALAGCRNEGEAARRGSLTVSQASARTFASVAAADAPSAPTVAVAAPVDAPATPKRAAPTAPAAPGKLTVKRLVVAQGVEKREPVGVASSFSTKDAGKLYGFVELENPARTENDVVLSFERDTEADTKGNVKLAVGASPRWRTWGFSRAVKEAGTWSVVVRDAAGTELARERFEVTL